MRATPPPPARRRSTRSRGPALATSVLAAVLLAGCAGEAAGTATAGAGSPASTSAEAGAPTPAASSSAEPAPEPAAEPAESSAAGAAPPPPAEPAEEAPPAEVPAAEVPAAEVPTGGTEGLPGWPIESVPVHGGQYWAAYLAVGAPGDPALPPVLAEVQELWPGAGLGELGCDDGAAAALGREAGDHAVAVYFPTEQHITEFRRRRDGPYLGAARVTTFCGD